MRRSLVVSALALTCVAGATPAVADEPAGSAQDRVFRSGAIARTAGPVVAPPAPEQPVVEQPGGQQPAAVAPRVLVRLSVRGVVLRRAVAVGPRAPQALPGWRVAPTR